MNDDGILLLSYVMEVLVLISIVGAALVLWGNARARRAARLKDASTTRSRLSSILEEHKSD